ARAVLPHFALTPRNARAVAQVCRRLDGMPLAIELAAARVRGLAVEQLAARLDQRFHLLTGGSRTALARQQTLRATVDWSYGLLDPAERQLFNRLSVFAGGFTLEGVESVCAGDGPAPEVLDVLLRLVDKSLVAMEEGEGGEIRYRLLETLRAYGQERIEAAGGTDALQARHARYYLTLAERAEREMRGPGMSQWLDRLDLEYANLTAALDWSLPATDPTGGLDPGDPAIGLRLAGALWLFWFLHGHRWVGLQWLERALARAREATPARAMALRGAGRLSNEVDDYGHALAFLEESLTIFRLVDEQADLADALCEAGGYARGEQLGFDIGHRGDYERGSALLAEGQALARAVGDPWRIMWSLLSDAGTFDVHRAEERARGRVAAEEVLRLARTEGGHLEVAFAQRTLGCVALAEGDYARAQAAFSAALAATRALGDRGGIAADLKHLADTARAVGDLDGARAGYEESLALYRVLDFDREWQAHVLCRLGEVALEQGNLSRARAHLGESLRTARALAERGTRVAVLAARVESDFVPPGVSIFHSPELFNRE
ncbi:MAG: ATP-binding protein, partial [Chloroflexota bacterium]